MYACIQYVYLSIYLYTFMLQVILILRLIRFQTRSVCFNLGQHVSIQVGLGQVQNTGHRLLFYQIIQKQP